LEIERGGASYTVDTLEEIHDANPDASLTLIVGADMALTLAGWRQPQRLLELAELAIAERRPADRERVMTALAVLGVADERVHFLSMRPIDVSSSLVREQIATGEAVDGMLPASIARYVEEHNLYTS
jgi:nicotinate-nucleotide adenylyltransferase